MEHLIACLPTLSLAQQQTRTNSRHQNLIITDSWNRSKESCEKQPGLMDGIFHSSQAPNKIRKSRYITSSFKHHLVLIVLDRWMITAMKGALPFLFVKKHNTKSIQYM
jgi:hypothetical protein